ncbi:DUF421 domain-containing protein [Chryseobacterium taklimakanense]|uniref:DUF421 domain-containing protein n=1 Tax=Chryseobacterium taklimakanense TaxID=536441 RepID=A0A3G8WUV5_9FLAO|nr:YetF domain-containing protein [Chryseobacterium taklimakanense]AZI20171.1 DUF421 domain-containing protein [Chryseobacterium taklimakanense]
MMKFIPENPADIFIPEIPLIEILLRGIILYFLILFILRVLPRRSAGELGPMDLVFILLLTEAASNALGDFTTLGDGIIMLVVFVICNYGVNYLTYHHGFFRKLFEHRPVQIIKDGRLIYRNMRRELITKDELMANLRENGIEDVSDVKKAFVESEGNISFIKYEEKG